MTTLARRLHDRVCMSTDTCGRSEALADDHARRTQTGSARTLRKAEEPHRLLHDAECLRHLDSSMTCSNPAAHAEAWRPTAAALLG